MNSEQTQPTDERAKDYADHAHIFKEKLPSSTSTNAKIWQIRVIGQWFGDWNVGLSILRSLTRVGVFEYRSISIAAIIANVHKGETIIWINQSHKLNREGPLVIEEEATRFTWSLNHDVFPIQCPNAVGKVPSSMKPLFNLYPIFFCRWRHFHGLQFLPDNLTCTTDDSVHCCHP